MPGFLSRLNGDETLGALAIICGAIVLCVLIVTIGWATMHSTKVKAALKQDMLARNLSVEQIEKLTQSENVRLTSLPTEERIKQAQIQADLKRDLLTRGLPVDDVVRITASSVAPGESKAHVEAVALAGAIAQMVRGQGASIDEDAVAGLIELVLRRNEAQPAPAPLPVHLPAREDRAPVASSDNVRPLLG